VCDPIRRTLVIFEVLWRIGPDGSFQVADTERAAAAKRVQVARLRGEIASGESHPRWPANWPALEGFRTSWFVLTPETLPVVPHATGDVIVRSHQLLARMLRRGATTADLIALLEDPPIPPTADARGWSRIQYGSLTIEVDAAA
jgi:hypothetical protein